MKTFILLGILSTACLLVASKKPERCDPSYCKLPDCYCGGQDIPGGLSKDEIPQFVLLTFDDAVNNLNKKFFEKLFKGRTNPNGCPIKSTFYVSHEWTDYSHVQDLYADGHEIASHTVTHSHGSQFGEEKWANEIVGEAEMLVRYAGVNPQDIKGMRAPFLAIGGDTMFNTLNRYGFYYDSSMSVAIPSWPYTLEYRMPHSCAVKPCPEQSHPGMWEVPMTTIKDIRGGTCSMADGCFYEEKATSIQKIFTQNFLEHYTKSKAPFPLFFHAAWFFNRPHRVDGFLKFIDSILALPDVYFVTSQELINWVRYPEPLDTIINSPVVGCSFTDRPARCGRKKAKCQLKHKGDVRQFATCQTTCPNRYPWVSNLNGD
eukprot:TRINITY_DN966_c0_g1_i1.p1 TRINITY_DN966_c0_g1~~TRINITY_DN966_c0_g1_i1.p1  ORF type:complete len:373 (+),score=122.55 TRINITY_DN966_c0_g1_i1:178-1296(+)